MKRSYLYLLLIAALLTSCSQLGASKHQAIKTGVIYDLHNQTAISREQLIDSMLADDYVVLGERHDNPKHHQLQLWVLQQLQEKQWLTQLSMEMIEPKQQAAYGTLAPKDAGDKATLQKTLAWADDGWPWNDYASLLQLAVKNSIKVQSANIDGDDIKALYKGIQPASQVVLSNDARTELLRDIEASHCGYIKEPQTSNMLSVQLARDHSMAKSLLQTNHGAALIAGAFHARKDLGFPVHLQQLDANKKLLSLAFVEADEAATQTQLITLAQQYDVIWVTPVHKRGDPCAEFKK